MYRAYDTMLQVPVSAHEAARNGDEYYRYECLCCGEEVYIAAAYGPIMDKQKALYKENRELTKLRDWLLPMLMNGQVTVE